MSSRKLWWRAHQRTTSGTKRSRRAIDRAVCCAEPLEGRTLLAAELVKDINESDPGSNPAGIAIAGTYYFAADDGINGRELWKSDGTAAGTVMIKDIHLGPSSSSPANLTNVGGTLYFTAVDSAVSG